ncbi:MAG TPA: DUF4178 domain-containing protein [Cyclobacteriaceae bacterium]|nr:DUF4178 domain-containing protein [Cyclobacteriaceae bacterium]
MTLAMTCPNCHIYYRRGNWNKDITKFENTYPQALPLGAKGKIDGTVYEVMGFLVKKEKRYKYTWREYMLFNPYLGYAFLSEYDGHWNFIWPIEDNPKEHRVDNSFVYEHETYQLFQKYNAEVIYANGEFFFDVVDLTDSTLTEEYIAPPFLLGREVNEDSLLWFKGEYITEKELSEAFDIPAKNFPQKRGLGYTEPVSTSFSDQSLIIVGILLCLFVILSQLFLSSFDKNTVVYQDTFSADKLTSQKVFITPSFTLEGSSKNLDIETYAPLSNDWFYAEFTLINEDDGTEYNFTKEIEYYSGYEGGESWSEGSMFGEALLSKIPGGHYHINIYPEFSTLNHEFSIKVTRDLPTYTNMWVVILCIIIYPAVYLVHKRYREQARWSESDYSPYD